MPLMISRNSSQLIEFFTINDLAVSARSGRSESEFYVCLSVDTWYLKIQVHSRTCLLPLLVLMSTLYISTTSKNYNSYLPDLAETAKFLKLSKQMHLWLVSGIVPSWSFRQNIWRTHPFDFFVNNQRHENDMFVNYLFVLSCITAIQKFRKMMILNLLMNNFLLKVYLV